MGILWIFILLEGFSATVMIYQNNDYVLSSTIMKLKCGLGNNEANINSSFHGNETQVTNKLQYQVRSRFKFLFVLQCRYKLHKLSYNLCARAEYHIKANRYDLRKVIYFMGTTLVFNRLKPVFFQKPIEILSRKLLRKLV